jgi:hypothetical protein
MNAYVGVTDRDWFDFLSAQDHVDEVNFLATESVGWRVPRSAARRAIPLQAQISG